MTGPLDGVIVVALEQAIAAPFATRQLADLGARVLKVERPGEGDFARSYDTVVGGSSAFFVWANRAKDSIELDLKDPTDRTTFDQLVAGADVFIQNLSPTAAERAGVLAQQLVDQHPALIAVDVSGYGAGGPRSDDKAYDLAVQAEAGAIALTGPADQPCKVGLSVADISTAMYALSGILAALYRRQATGQGAVIELSMLECLSEWNAAHIYAAAGRGSDPQRSGHRHAAIAPYGMYALSDGSSILIAVQNQREWAAFTDVVLERAELAHDGRFATNPDRIANVDALEVEIAAVFSSITAKEVRARLEAAGITNSTVQTPLGVFGHEQLRARDRFMTVRTPTGEAEVFKPPFNIDDVSLPEPSVPALGQHDPDLVAELLARASENGS